MELTDLQIRPNKVEHGQSSTLAYCDVVIDGDLQLKCDIREKKSGIYVKWFGFKWVNPERRKEFCNRVLATYVINHCISEYQT